MGAQKNDHTRHHVGTEMSLGCQGDPAWVLYATFRLAKTEWCMCTEMLTKIVEHGYHLILFFPHFLMLFDVLIHVCIFILYSEEKPFSWDRLYKCMLWAHGRIEWGIPCETSATRTWVICLVLLTLCSREWEIRRINGSGERIVTNNLQTYAPLCLSLFPETLAHYSEWQSRVWTPGTLLPTE